MEITDFLEQHASFYSPEIKAEIHSRLVLRALRKEEPGFVIKAKNIVGSTVYVTMFDDGPELWLNTHTNVHDALKFCQQYNLVVSKVDGAPSH